MRWVNILLLAVLMLMLALATVRSVPRRRIFILLLLDLPFIVLVVRWAAYRGEWREMALAALAAGVAFVLWWFVHGRRLGPPRDDNIRVLTKDDPL
jgi:hypothetical protein